VNWSRNDRGVILSDLDGVGVAVGVRPSGSGWWWTADHFFQTRDLRARGFRRSQESAKNSAEEAARLILRLRALEEEGT
jgi:hypothetical protein